MFVATLYLINLSIYFQFSISTIIDEKIQYEDWKKVVEPRFRNIQKNYENLLNTIKSISSSSLVNETESQSVHENTEEVVNDPENQNIKNIQSEKHPEQILTNQEKSLSNKDGFEISTHSNLDIDIKIKAQIIPSSNPSNSEKTSSNRLIFSDPAVKVNITDGNFFEKSNTNQEIGSDDFIQTPVEGSLALHKSETHTDSDDIKKKFDTIIDSINEILNNSKEICMQNSDFFENFFKNHYKKDPSKYDEYIHFLIYNKYFNEFIKKLDYPIMSRLLDYKKESVNNEDFILILKDLELYIQEKIEDKYKNISHSFDEFLKLVNARLGIQT